MPRIKIEDLDKISKKVKRTTILREGAGRAKITVHMGTCGISAGAREIMSTLMAEIEKKEYQRYHINHIRLCWFMQQGTYGNSGVKRGNSCKIY